VANYVKSTNFAVKDSLTTGDPAKVVKGTEIDVEFNNIASAISSKLDASGSSVAFLNQAQTFTASQTFSANQTIGANLTFTGNQRKIVAPFDGAHQNANAFSVQNSTTNAGTVFGLIPNGTNKGSSFFAYTSSTDQLNCNYGFLLADDTQVKINSDSVGTGVTTKIRIDTDDNERITITPTGEVSVNSATNSDTSLTVAANGRTYSLRADQKVLLSGTYGNTVGATNRTLYIDNGGVLGGLSSTRESKTNITPITNTDWILSLEPVSYNRKLKNNDGSYSDVASPNTEFGLIADDVANVRPEICVFVNGKVSGINYEQLISPMLKEIQKLRAEVESLKEKVNG
jgi:hypothetical protein